MADTTPSTTTSTAGAPATGTVSGDMVVGDTAVMGTSASELGGTAGSDPAPFGSRADDLKAKATETYGKVKVEAGKGRDQALAAATTYADQGKGKAAGALTTLSGLLVEGAKMLEENFGHKAADPVRAQADRVSGAARHLETSDVDQLTAELTAFAKKNPVLSVGTVAIVGFALGKLLSGGGHDD